MSAESSSLELEPVEISDPTGGRNPPANDVLITTASNLLERLVTNLESDDLKFSQPYDPTVAKLIKVLSEMDFESLKKIYTDVDKGIYTYIRTMNSHLETIMFEIDNEILYLKGKRSEKNLKVMYNHYFNTKYKSVDSK